MIGGWGGRVGVGHSSWTAILKKYFLEEIISQLDAVLTKGFWFCMIEHGEAE